MCAQIILFEDQPRPNPDICMNPYDALVVQHPVSLPDNLEHLVPWALCIRRSALAQPCFSSLSSPGSRPPLTNGCPIGMHGVLQATLFEKSLDLRDIGAHRGAVDTHLSDSNEKGH